MIAPSPNHRLLSTAELEATQRLVQHNRRRPRHAAQSHSGSHHSIKRGAGLELADLRPYEVGDEVRYIDWRTTARTGRPMTKIFQEEHQRVNTIVVDRGLTMRFGTRGTVKAASAARAGALVAFSALASGDRVAGLVCDHDISYYAPSRHLDQVLRFLHAVCAPLCRPSSAEADDDSDRLQFLEHLMHVAPNGASVNLISDFAMLGESHLPLLKRLRHRRNVLAIQIIDPAEEYLADVGLLRLCAPGGGKPVLIDTGNAELRAHYARIMARRQNRLTHLFRSAGIRHTVIHTNRPSSSALQHLL